MEMAILMTEHSKIPINQGRTFHFTSEDLLKNKKVAKPDIVCSINVKHGIIAFPPNTVKQLNLTGNRVKFYVDTGAKVIGFKLKSQFDSLLAMKTWRQLVLKNSVAKTTIIPIIKELKKQGTLYDSYKKITIKRWKDKNSVLDGEEYYYLDLREYERKNDRRAADGTDD